MAAGLVRQWPAHAPTEARGRDLEMAESTAESTDSKHPLDSLLDDELAKLRPEMQEKIVEYQDAIQPHTDEGGDVYYIGDAHKPANPACVSDWRLQK